MKRELSSVLVSLVAVLAASASANATNTITFNGDVTDQTCSAVVNGGTDPTVILKSVPLSDLDGAVGNTAGEGTFTLTLTGCAASGTDEAFTTLFQATNPTATGNLTNTANAGAEGVALQLLDAPGGTPVNLAGGAAVAAGEIVLTAGETTATHDYAVRYIAESATVTPGPVLGSVTYTVRYE
ncbi:fimbrial protein [Stenotrophomonas sp.]|uniref:fimbrial protein n=1 Tax=Stenotrophomonas sp. TaxID=69392 RepID=UPI0028A83665|nr:fimbrial protein [Stenotrophomonas sp.]